MLACSYWLWVQGQPAVLVLRDHTIISHIYPTTLINEPRSTLMYWWSVTALAKFGSIQNHIAFNWKEKQGHWVELCYVTFIHLYFLKLVTSGLGSSAIAIHLISSQFFFFFLLFYFYLFTFSYLLYWIVEI